MTDQKLTAILRECFEDEAIAARPDLDIRALEKWDSFRHINMVVAVEEAFDVIFMPAEVEAIRLVSDLTAVLARQGKA